MKLSDKKYRKLGVVILAAGLSKRMGRLKSFLLYTNGQTFIEKIISEYLDFGCDRLSVITGKTNEKWENLKAGYKENTKVHFIENLYPEYERFYSVRLGLADNKEMDFCFIQNCDNPFIDFKTLTQIARYADEDAYVVPNYEGRGGHPILLGKNVINRIISENNGTNNLKERLREFKRINIGTSSDNILVNINTESDYREYIEKSQVRENSK